MLCSQASAFTCCKALVVVVRDMLLLSPRDGIVVLQQRHGLLEAVRVARGVREELELAGGLQVGRRLPDVALRGRPAREVACHTRFFINVQKQGSMQRSTQQRLLGAWCSQWILASYCAQGGVVTMRNLGNVP